MKIERNLFWCPTEINIERNSFIADIRSDFEYVFISEQK